MMGGLEDDGVGAAWVGADRSGGAGRLLPPVDGRPRPGADGLPSRGGGAVIGVLGGGLACWAGGCSGASAPPPLEPEPLEWPFASGGAEVSTPASRLTYGRRWPEPISIRSSHS